MTSEKQIKRKLKLKRLKHKALLAKILDRRDRKRKYLIEKSQKKQLNLTIINTK